MLQRQNLTHKANFITLLGCCLLVIASSEPLRAQSGAESTIEAEKTLQANLPSNNFEQLRVGPPEAQTKNKDTSSIQKDITGKSNPLGGSISTGRAILSLMLVLALIVLAAWLYRRFTVGSRSGRVNSAIEIITRTTVNPKQSVCLVRLDRRLVLVGLSPNHMTSLLVLDDPEDIGRIMGLVEKQSPHSVSKGFDKLFHRQAQDYNLSTEASDEEPDTQVFDYEDQTSGQWSYARRELSGLLNKVKGLTRLRF